MIRDEDGQLTGYVYIDLNTTDYGGFVSQASNLLRQKLQLPAGYIYQWSGEYEFQQRAKERLKIILPVVFSVIFLLLYMIFHSVTEAMVLIFPTFYAMTGGLILQWLLGYNFSVAVWVGYIALFGIAVETGVAGLACFLTAADDFNGRQEPIVARLIGDQLQGHARWLAEDAQECCTCSARALQPPCLAAVARMQDGAERTDGPAAMFVDEPQATERRGLFGARRLPGLSAVGRMHHACARSAGDPNVAAQRGERTKIELAAGEIGQWTRRRSPGKTAVGGYQHQSAIADEPAAG